MHMRFMAILPFPVEDELLGASGSAKIFTVR